MNIRPAQLDDVEKIYEIAVNNSLSNIKTKKPVNGFLISNYD